MHTRRPAAMVMRICLAIRAEFVRQCDKLDGLADGNHQQLLGLPRHLRHEPGIGRPQSMGLQTCPNNVDYLPLGV